MPSDETIDFVIVFVMIGLLTLGLGSMLLGKLVAWWDAWRESVNRFQVPPDHVMSKMPQTVQTDQTDGTDQALSVADQWLDRIELDRTRTTVIELLVYSGWSVSEVRSVIKGDSGAIGQEVESVRQRRGHASSHGRELLVRDGTGERVIPM